MTFETLKLLLEPNNFRPFRVVLNNGRSYEVRHSEFAVLTEQGALFLFKPSDEPEAHTAQAILAVVSTSNILEVQPLQQAA